MHLPSQILETQALITRCGDDWALGRVGLTLSCRFLPFLACFGVVGGCRFPSFPTCKLNPIIASPTESQPGQLRVRTQWVPPSQAATPIRPKVVLSLPSRKFRRPLLAGPRGLGQQNADLSIIKLVLRTLDSYLYSFIIKVKMYFRC